MQSRVRDLRSMRFLMPNGRTVTVTCAKSERESVGTYLDAIEAKVVGKVDREYAVGAAFNVVGHCELTDEPIRDIVRCLYTVPYERDEPWALQCMEGAIGCVTLFVPGAPSAANGNNAGGPAPNTAAGNAQPPRRKNKKPTEVLISFCFP